MACQGSVSLGPIHKFLLMLVFVGHPVWLFAKTLDQDPYNHLAPNMLAVPISIQAVCLINFWTLLPNYRQALPVGHTI